MQETIYVYWSDIGRAGPRGGCGFFAVQRQIRSVVQVPGGEKAEIEYCHRSVAVYRREGSSAWSTRETELLPVRGTYLNRGIS